MRRVLPDGSTHTMSLNEREVLQADCLRCLAGVDRWVIPWDLRELAPLPVAIGGTDSAGGIAPFVDEEDPPHCRPALRPLPACGPRSRRAFPRGRTSRRRKGRTCT